MDITGELPEKQNCSAADNISQSDIPVNVENRRKTDPWFSYIFIVCFLLLVPFQIYTLFYSDVNRLNGFDYCGNVCGKKNIRYDQWNCTGQDMSLKPINYASKCMSGEEYNSYDHPWWFELQNDFARLKNLMLTVLAAICCSLGFSVLLTFSIIYATVEAIWVVLITCWLSFPAIITCLCIFYLPEYRVLTIMHIFVLTLLFCISIPKKNQIRLVIKFLRATSNAIYNTRHVAFTTSMTVMISFTVLLAHRILGIFINTSGHLTEIMQGRLYFIADKYMIATAYLTHVFTLWVVLFIIGIGSLKTSEAIASRYFLKRRDGLTAIMTLKYHAGTVALVSLLSVLTVVPRLILVVLAQISAFKQPADYCLRYLEGFSSKSVYVITAMHGTAFSRSGQRAVKLARCRTDDSESLHYFGYAVIMLIEMLIVIVSTFLAVKMSKVNFRSVIDGMVMLYPFSYLVTELILGTFKVALSTIFYSICQDDLLKKESNQSRNINMEEYLDRSNKIFSNTEEFKHPSSNLELIENV